MDRRKAKTREAIFKAFEDLLDCEDYSKITVQQIIDQANIGRSTFYAHFETKDDVLKSMCADLFDHIFSKSLESEETHDFSLEEGEGDAMIAHILYHLRDNGRVVRGMLASDGSDIFLRYFESYLDELVSNYLLSNPNRASRSIPDDFLVNHISGSFLEMVKWWAHDGMKVPPEQLSEYYLKVISPII